MILDRGFRIILAAILVVVAGIGLSATGELVPTAGAQGNQRRVSVRDFLFEPSQLTVEPGTTTVLQPTGGGSVGGPAVVLPAAAALLVGSGVLTYTALRRRR